MSYFGIFGLFYRFNVFPTIYYPFGFFVPNFSLRFLKRGRIFENRLAPKVFDVSFFESEVVELEM